MSRRELFLNGFTLRWVITMVVLTTAVLIGFGAFIGMYLHPVFELRCVRAATDKAQQYEYVFQCERTK